MPPGEVDRVGHPALSAGPGQGHHSGAPDRTVVAPEGSAVRDDDLVQAEAVLSATPEAPRQVRPAARISPDRLPAGVRAGIGSAESPDRSWREARTALRFATPCEPVVHYADLGALALLAEVPRGALRENPDVAAPARVAGNPEDLDTLDAYCAALTCTTAASPAGSNRAARHSASASPAPRV